MARIAWITDSTAYLEADTVRARNVHIVPLNVVFGERSYREGEEIDEAMFYRLVQETKVHPTTSQPSLGDFVRLYERLKGAYDVGIAVHLSGGISGTVETSRQAAEMVGFPVHVIDSRIATYPMSFILKAGMRLADEGHAVKDIVRHMEDVRDRMRALFVVKDLTYLHRGGRLNMAQYVVGSLLQVKPILHFVEGKIVPLEKVRTEKKAVARVFELFDEAVRGAPGARVAIIHANVPDEAMRWRETLAERYQHLDVVVSSFGPVIATHVGEGTIGFGWYALREGER
ncbi:MAG: DegV family protein [Hydrogenibacillus sp.]|nr:DegV family protein [Hydrogenibacillus sp.]